MYFYNTCNSPRIISTRPHSIFDVYNRSYLEWSVKVARVIILLAKSKSIRPRGCQLTIQGGRRCSRIFMLLQRHNSISRNPLLTILLRSLIMNHEARYVIPLLPGEDSCLPILSFVILHNYTVITVQRI